MQFELVGPRHDVSRRQHRGVSRRVGHVDGHRALRCVPRRAKSGRDADRLLAVLRRAIQRIHGNVDERRKDHPDRRSGVHRHRHGKHDYDDVHARDVRRDAVALVHTAPTPNPTTPRSLRCELVAVYPAALADGVLLVINSPGAIHVDVQRIYPVDLDLDIAAHAYRWTRVVAAHGVTSLQVSLMRPPMTSADWGAMFRDPMVDGHLIVTLRPSPCLGEGCRDDGPSDAGSSGRDAGPSASATEADART